MNIPFSGYFRKRRAKRLVNHAKFWAWGQNWTKKSGHGTVDTLTLASFEVYDTPTSEFAIEAPRWLSIVLRAALIFVMFIVVLYGAIEFCVWFAFRSAGF